MKERETDGRFKIGDIIADKDAGTLMIVDRRESEDSTWGKYEYEVHWSREGDTSWISEMLLMGIKAAGMKKYLSLMLDALKKSSVDIGARAQAREEWLVEQTIEREESVKKEK